MRIPRAIGASCAAACRSALRRENILDAKPALKIQRGLPWLRKYPQKHVPRFRRIWTRGNERRLAHYSIWFVSVFMCEQHIWKSKRWIQTLQANSPLVANTHTQKHTYTNSLELHIYTHQYANIGSMHAIINAQFTWSIYIKRSGKTSA